MRIANGPLDKMAKNMVGDGRQPNLYFVSELRNNVLKCTAIMSDGLDARDFTANTNADLLEDRMRGQISISHRLEKENG